MKIAKLQAIVSVVCAAISLIAMCVAIYVVFVAIPARHAGEDQRYRDFAAQDAEFCTAYWKVDPVHSPDMPGCPRPATKVSK